MKINSVEYKPIQTKQQVGFGTHIMIDDSIKQLVETPQEAKRILRVIKKIAADGKNYIIRVAKADGEDYLQGKLLTPDNKKTLAILPPTDNRNRLIPGTFFVSNLIEIIYNKSKQYMKIEDQMNEAQDMLRHIK